MGQGCRLQLGKDVQICAPSGRVELRGRSRQGREGCLWWAFEVNQGRKKHDEGMIKTGDDPRQDQLVIIGVTYKSCFVILHF
jgi:hypothetical protein